MEAFRVVFDNFERAFGVMKEKKATDDVKEEKAKSRKKKETKIDIGSDDESPRPAPKKRGKPDSEVSPLAEHKAKR